MTTYIHRNSTCLLNEALNPEYLPQELINAANGPDQILFQIEVREEVHKLHDRLFPQWWNVPPPTFTQHVADVRERVHRSFRNAGYLNEIHQFFLEIRVLVRGLNPDNDFWTTGWDQRPDNGTQTSMNSVPRYMTQARAQSQPQQQTQQQQPQATVQVYETEMDIDSESDMESEGIAAVTMRQIVRTSRTVPGRQPGRWGQRQRRPVEGDCTICLNPLVRTSGGQIQYKPHKNIVKGCRPDGIDHPPTGKLEIHSPCSDEDDDSWEDEIVWCRAFCGTNYHLGCIDEWLEQSINVRATCPTCRRPWYD